MIDSSREGREFYKPNGDTTFIPKRHRWEPEDTDNTQGKHIALCVRHQLIVPDDSCAISCIMAAYRATREGL